MNNKPPKSPANLGVAQATGTTFARKKSYSRKLDKSKVEKKPYMEKPILPISTKYQPAVK